MDWDACAEAAWGSAAREAVHRIRPPVAIPHYWPGCSHTHPLAAVQPLAHGGALPAPHRHLGALGGCVAAGGSAGGGPEGTQVLAGTCVQPCRPLPEGRHSPPAGAVPCSQRANPGCCRRSASAGQRWSCGCRGGRRRSAGDGALGGGGMRRGCGSPVRGGLGFQGIKTRAGQGQGGCPVCQAHL